MNSQAIAHIQRRQSRSSVGVSAAWLEAPEGSQLPSAANSDLLSLATQRENVLIYQWPIPI
ncbi:DUF1481 domain-containing protein [Shigella flexneri]